ncbi:deacetylase-like protein [Diplodia corticola]|uniref:Deacetylase-like protein n=1 Tax=Diplodia corticola TaxID=236234 RepID=A0A1J9QP33_9PEZI|nr:deacetylase-like protein [Diplodia corticola]OJD30670.1 deacetylase-like protein [Diplodia corticola]
MADDQPQPRNRKERRAAAKASGTPLSSAKAPKPAAPTASKLDFSQSTPADNASSATENDLGIPMALPDFSGPKGKTLYEIAEERMRELHRTGKDVSSLEGERVEFPVDGKGDAMRVSGEDDFGPVAEALLYAFTLTALHFTLDVLVHNQYRERIAWAEIWPRTAQVAPILWLVVYMFKTPTAMRFPMLRQWVFFATAVAAGCYCVYVGNAFGYYAVMKQAPPVGVLWIWTVVELDLFYAAGSVVIVLGYTWWNRFGLF